MNILSKLLEFQPCRFECRDQNEMTIVFFYVKWKHTYHFKRKSMHFFLLVILKQIMKRLKKITCLQCLLHSYRVGLHAFQKHFYLPPALSPPSLPQCSFLTYGYAPELFYQFVLHHHKCRPVTRGVVSYNTLIFFSLMLKHVIIFH